MTQTDVREAAGVGQSTVSEFETGTAPNITAENLLPMCRAVGVTAEYVWFGGESASAAEEQEAVALLRSASPVLRDAAIRSLRAMLATAQAEPGKRAGAGRQ